jgi:hypothetical protein
VTHSKETGIWRSENGVVSLDPKARVGEFPTLPNFLPAYARKLIPQRQGVSRLLVNADHPKDFILKETKSPNPPLQTPTSGTPAAGVPVAPPPGAARQ